MITRRRYPRRRRSTQVTSETRDLLYDLIYAGPSLESIRDRLREVSADNNLWEQLKEFENSSKILSAKLTRLMNKSRK